MRQPMRHNPPNDDGCCSGLANAILTIAPVVAEEIGTYAVGVRKDSAHYVAIERQLHMDVGVAEA